MSDIVEVAVAAIINSRNEVLISLRPNHVHQGGLWEFPGGKLDIGETIEQALYREIKEELNVSIQSAHPLISLQHEYADKTVRLHVWKVTEFALQENVGLNHNHTYNLGAEGQEIKWQSVHELNIAEFPAADKSIITALQLPDQYLITGVFESIGEFKTRLSAAINRGITLLQLRLKSTWVESHSVLAKQVFRMAVELCEQNEVTLMLNVPETLRLSMLGELNNKNIGLHLDSSRLNEVGDVFHGFSLRESTQSKYISASCHTQADLETAKNLGVDFIVLSPVQKTASHPNVRPLGWQQFTGYVRSCDYPVYALGGVTVDDIDIAKQSGAQGIAGIRYGW